jgi:GNAT superfamily N-acetyltransferase
VDAISPGGSFDEVTAALSGVGLGSVPTWLRPYGALSNGERFRADLARVICEAPPRVVIDEFSSVVDRQIAKFGALAFAKAWRRTGAQAVLLSCHYDVLDWLQPDWVLDTASGEFHRGRWLRPRPPFDLEIRKVDDGKWWPYFAPHHYLKAPLMIGAYYYVGFVDGEPVCHLGVATKNVGKAVEARACRLVVMPEWQGAGIGVRFLEEICLLQLRGEGRLAGRQMTTIFHTSHPGLCAALRNRPGWRQVSAVLHGGQKVKSRESLNANLYPGAGGSGYGGHFRAVQGFRFYGRDRVPGTTRGG